MNQERLRSFGDHHKMDILLVVLVVVGTGLRLWQYIANTSLWLDEILLASNILHHSMRDLLLTPLSYGQAAPQGFVFLEKLAALSLGRSDYALRLVPLLCSLAALVGFWRIVRRFLQGLAAPIALALFVTATPLVIFGSQVKQYSVDVAVAVFLLWLSLNLAGRGLTFKRSLWAGVAGAASVWFSQPAVLVVFALGVSLALIALCAPSDLRIRRLLSLGPVLGLWSVSALFATFAALASMTPATSKFMHQYWASGLLPSSRWQALETLWPSDQLKALIGLGGQASLGYPYPVFYLLLVALGFWLLWRRLGAFVALFLAPVAVTLAAAVARQYPFSDRLILFLVPNFFVVIAASIDWTYWKLASWSKYAGWLVVIALLSPAVYPIAALPPPYRIEDMKTIMSHVQENLRPGDAVYLYYGARLPFAFYSRDYGFGDNDYKVGLCHQGDNRGYFRELDMFRGSPRLWVVLSHAWPPFKERDDILHYLDTIGLRRDAFAVQSRVVGNWALPAEVLLYDLSDTRRLANATAESISLMGTKSRTPLQGCGEGPQIMVPPRGEHEHRSPSAVMAQALNFSPTGIAFGNQSISAYSIPRIIKVTNIGSSTLTISSITVSSGFAILHWTSPNHDCTSIGSVAAGGACQITVAFEPTVAIVYSGKLTVSHNTSDSPLTVALSGTGTASATPSLSTNWIALNRAGAGESNNQCYSPSNATVNNALFLHTYLQPATCTSFDEPTLTTHYFYTSSNIAMRAFNFLYGTVEWRGKFGGGANSGLWGIVWMLDASCQASDPTGTDNSCNGQEIDLTEILHSDFTHINQQIHVNNGAHNDGCTATVTDASQNYHTYDLVWSAGSLIWKVDGTMTCAIRGSYVPNVPMYVKLTNIVGSFGGTISNSTLPWSTEVDYVRVIAENGKLVFYDTFPRSQF